MTAATARAGLHDSHGIKMEILKIIFIYKKKGYIYIYIYATFNRMGSVLAIRAGH